MNINIYKAVLLLYQLLIFLNFFLVYLFRQRGCKKKFLPVGCLPLFFISPSRWIGNKQLFKVGLKSVLLFLTNQTVWFISRGIGPSYFSKNFLLPFLLWHNFKILVKSRGGGTFLCLALSDNIRQKKLSFNWKLNILYFIFLIWTEQFWIWFSRN